MSFSAEFRIDRFRAKDVRKIAGVRALRETNGSVVRSYHKECMAFPLKVCVVCSEEFELKPDKPGFANRCPECSEPESTGSAAAPRPGLVDGKADVEMNAARRRAIRDLLYSKEN